MSALKFVNGGLVPLTPTHLPPSEVQSKWRHLSMMQQLTTKLRKPFVRWEAGKSPTAATPHADQTIVSHDGINYKILPLEDYNQICRRWSGYEIGCFTLGAAMVAFCAGYTIDANKPPSVIEKVVTVEKPIVIEKPVKVDSGCLAFCNR